MPHWLKKAYRELLKHYSTRLSGDESPRTQVMQHVINFASENYTRLFDMHGRVALVTGAAGWLGAPMCLALAFAGAKVVMVGRTSQTLNEFALLGGANGLSLEPVQCDVRDHFACMNMMQTVLRKHGHLDVLVNNASSGVPGGKGLDASAEFFAEAADIHTGAAWRMINLALPGLKSAVRVNGDASVINIGSMYAKVSPVPSVYEDTKQPPNPAYYGAAKAGLLQMTRWLACNLGPERIRVNSISPGAFPQRDARSRMPDFVRELDRKSPLGRVGQREEIAGPLLFLASKGSSYVTGADIAVDGGWSSW